MQVRQRGQNRIDLLEFLAKLTEVMERERNIELKGHVDSQRQSDEGRQLL